MTAVEEGESAKLRLVFYSVSGTGEAGELQEEEHRVFDLFYEDDKYLLYYEEDGKAVRKEYAALKCFQGDYYKQEWVLLGESFQEADYETILSADVFSSRAVSLDSYVPGAPTWQIIYFSDGERETSASSVSSVSSGAGGRRSVYIGNSFAGSPSCREFIKRCHIFPG